MSVNDDLFSTMVRHQIGLNRLSAGISRDLLKVLNKYDNRIKSVISNIDQDTKPRAVQRAINELQKVNQAAYAEVGKALSKNMLDVAKHEVNYQDKTLATTLRRDVMGQLSVKKPSVSTLKEAVETAPINGALLNEYVKGMEEGRFRRMRDVVRREVAKGGPAVSEGVTRAIMGSSATRGADGVLGLSRRSLDQTTRTVQTGIVNQSRERYLEANDELFAGEQWVAMLETDTCVQCQSLDGTVFPVGEGPRPPVHINCRCTMTPLVKDWEALGLEDLGPGSRAAMNGEVPETLSYPEWLARQSKEVQDDALGPARAELFRKGMPVDRFVDNTGRRYTLEELARREGL